MHFVCNFLLGDVLKESLPEGLFIPSGFELIGDIAHLNLDEKQMEYRKIIGEAVLVKNPSLRSVVTKIGYI